MVYRGPLGADRVDVLESRIKALLTGRPDRRILETGVLRAQTGVVFARELVSTAQT
jgi:hypothetical protein